MFVLKTENFLTFNPLRLFLNKQPYSMGISPLSFWYFVCSLIKCSNAWANRIYFHNCLTLFIANLSQDLSYVLAVQLFHLKLNYSYLPEGYFLKLQG